MQETELEVTSIAGIGRVLILEDRPDVLQSEVSLLEALGIEFIAAGSEREAWDRIRTGSGDINIALVDKALESGDAAGILFLEELRREKASVRCYLVTAHDLSTVEAQRVSNIGAIVLTKGHFSLLAVLSQTTLAGGVAEDPVDSITEVRNRLLLEQATAAMYRQKYSYLHELWKRQASGLVNRLRADAAMAGGSGELVVNGEYLTYEDLVMNVVDATPLGVELLDLHNEAVESLFRRSGRGRSWGG